MGVDIGDLFERKEIGFSDLKGKVIVLITKSSVSSLKAGFQLFLIQVF